MNLEYKNFIKILIIIVFTILIFKTFSFLRFRLATIQEMERERNYNLADIEKIKAENSLQIAKIESQRIIIKACYDNKEFIDFVNCIKELKK